MRSWRLWLTLGLADADYASTLKWLRECGGRVGVAVGRPQTCSDCGLGLLAEKGIAGRVLLSVPSRCVLFEDNLLPESQDLQALAEHLRTNLTAKAATSNKLLLAVFLMQQLVAPQPVKRFAAYLTDLRSSVQRTIQAIPLYWAAEDQEELRGTSAASELPKMRRAIAKEFEVVSLVLPHLKHQLLEFQAAYVFVASRSFTLDVSNGVAQAALFPVIDLANHLWPKDTYDQHDSGEAAAVEFQHRPKAGTFEVLLRSQQPLGAGDEVTVSYGPFSNSHMLLRYGFVTPWLHTRTCLTKVKLQLQAEDARAPGILFALDKCPGTWHQALAFFRLWRCRRCRPSDADAEAKRRLAQCGVEVEKAPKAWRLDVSCGLLERDEEMNAVVDLELALQAAVRRYAGGSLKKEERLLGGKLRSHQRVAVVLRRDEKHTLQAVQEEVSGAKVRLSRLAGWRSYLDEGSKDEL
ncbi:unnamed protein product [Effrenium voratum]|uniref:SET domain-containing protein n=1 Tax=Effrenium voratum TaxID=2562239 RepID=A0AA36IIM8_9DINO|nr:unnamed protein product [Effrenium voratum]CAJ1452750.1 unnamed protein product [Effrenium voratum]